MNIYKKDIDNFIKCPFYFTLNKSESSNNYSQHKNVEYEVNKNALFKICNYEMKKKTKLSLYEQRIMYTNFVNKNFTSDNMISLSTVDLSKQIDNLNITLKILSECKVLSYNTPVPIPIQNSSYVYIDFADIILENTNKDIIVIQVEDLSNIEYYKTLSLYWPHYSSIFYKLAETLGKDIIIKIIDPILTKEIEFKIRNNTSYRDNLEKLSGIIKAIHLNKSLKNLHACNNCEVKNECFKKK